LNCDGANKYYMFVSQVDAVGAMPKRYISYYSYTGTTGGVNF
jgi:hypothetical protein